MGFELRTNAELRVCPAHSLGWPVDAMPMYR
jgi:hypothetical protein